ncbi:MAG: hypothetical protein CXT73_04555 [Methanobacteriota archaeon]|nr:MAG: hypothetical protein CXT73_04555 [Euryarchaeota archaeon]
MQKTALKKNKAMDKFLTWLNKNGAVFPDIYFQIYKNKFGPYYKILPKKFDNFPIFWSPAEKKYLENSYLLTEIDIRKDILVKDYHKLCKILNDFSSICSLQKFLQIRTLVGSRNFGLWIDGKKQATMVPLGDMLNHSATPDVKCQ